MPSGLGRFRQSRQSRFHTFSCYHRQAKLFGRREGKSRFLDSAGSSALADDPAALEMTMKLKIAIVCNAQWTTNRNTPPWDK